MRAAHRAARDDINAIFADVKAGKVDGGSQIDRSVRMEGARLRAHPLRTSLIAAPGLSGAAPGSRIAYSFACPACPEQAGF